MSFLQEEIKNFTFKAQLGIAGTGDRDTAPDAFTLYEEANTFDIAIKPSQIIAQYDSIPPAKDLTTARANAVANPTLIADYSLATSAIRLTPASNNKAFFICSTYGDLSTRMKNWISPAFIPRIDVGFVGQPSIGYTMKLYQGDPNAGGTEITTSQDQIGAITGWLVMYPNGMIKVASNFSAITDPTQLYITGFRYIGDTGTAETENYINLYQYPTTYTITGGGTALKDSINTNGGGTIGSPKVYEVNDNLTYEAPDNLEGKSNIVIRGALGKRPKIQTTNTKAAAFSITNPFGAGGTNTSNITAGNFDIECQGDTADYQCGAIIWRNTGCTSTYQNINFKNLKVYHNGAYRSNGIIAKDEQSSTEFFIKNLTVEDCQFLDMYSGTDGGAIYTMGVDNYIGNRNIFSWIIQPSYKTLYVIAATNHKEYNSVFNQAPSGSSDSYKTYAKLRQDYLTACSNKETTVEFNGCKFQGCLGTARGAIRLSHDATSSPTISKIKLTVKNCTIADSLGPAIQITGDSIDHGALVSLEIQSNYFKNNTIALQKSTDFIAAFDKLDIKYNEYEGNAQNFSGFTDNTDALGEIKYYTADEIITAKVATTANITLSGAQTIDGISVVTGDIVLVKNQSTGSQNGLYVASTTTWNRYANYITENKIKNSLIKVLYGEFNGTQIFKNYNYEAAITVGTTTLKYGIFNRHKDTANYTVYVRTTGNDLDIGTITNPVKTIDKAVALMADVINLGISVTINLGAGTFNISNSLMNLIDGKILNGSIIFESDVATRYTTIETGTMTGNTHFTHTDSTKTWTVNQHVGRILHDNTSGEDFEIGGNTTNTLKCTGSNTYGPVSVGAYTIYEHATKITSSVGEILRGSPRSIGSNFQFNYIALEGDFSGYNVSLVNCKIDTTNSAFTNYNPNVAMWDCTIITGTYSARSIRFTTAIRCAFVTNAGVATNTTMDSCCVIPYTVGQKNATAVVYDEFSPIISTQIFINDNYIEDFKRGFSASEVGAFPAEQDGVTFVAADQFVYVNCQAAFYLTKGMTVMEDALYPVYDWGFGSGLSIGRATLDGSTLTTLYWDAQKKINAVAIAPSGQDYLRIDKQLQTNLNTTTPLPAGLTGIVNQSANADGTATRDVINGFGTTATPLLTYRRARGTAASPTAVQANDIMASLGVVGYGATGYSASERAELQAVAGSNWTDASHEAYWKFWTTPAGSIIPIERMRIADTITIPYTTPFDFRNLAMDVTRDIYVNTTTGNDDTGTGLVGAPFQTIKRAAKDIKAFVPAQVIINIIVNGAGTYNESGLLDVISRIVNQGTITIKSDATIRYGTAVVNNTFTSEKHFIKTQTGAGWTVNLYRGYVCEDISAAKYYPIGYNTADKLYIGGNTSYTTITIGEYNIKPYGVRINCEGRADNMIGTLNFEGVYLALTTSLTKYSFDEYNLTIANCHLETTQVLGQCLDFWYSSLLLTSNTKQQLGKLAFCVTSCDRPISCGGLEYETFFSDRSGVLVTRPALTGDSYNGFYAMDIRTFNCGCKNFKYFIGKDTSQYYYFGLVTLGGIYEWENVDFILYGFNGLMTKGDPTYPISAYDDANLNVGRLTIDGTTEARYYNDVVNNLWCALIAPTTKIAVNYGMAENTDVDLGGEVIDAFPDNINAVSCTWHLVAIKGTNYRKSKIDAIWDAANNVIQYSTEYDIISIGTTSGISYTVTLTSDTVALNASVPDNDWLIRSMRFLN